MKTYYIKTEINSELLSWQGLELKFDDDMSAEKSTETLTFTIKNDAEVGTSEYIDISVSTSATEIKNASISVTNSKNAGVYVLQPQEEITYIITFTILDTTANASLSGFAIDFNLSRSPISYVDALLKGLDFTFDEENKTASANKASTAPTGALTIPSMVTKNGVNYTVTSIGDCAFQECYVTSITIPNSVTSIGESAFQESGLTSITIGTGVTSIGVAAFSGCGSLTSITINATTPPTLGVSAIPTNDSLVIKVPSASVDSYKSASGWSDFADKIQAIPSN